MKPRHKKVQFNPEAWMGDTARMSRLVRSVYFDVCLFNWQKAEAMPEAELMMTLQDIGADGPGIVSLLIQTGKIVVSDDGGSPAYYVAEALNEALQAADLFERKSGGGKKGAAKTNAVESDETLAAGETSPPKVSPNDIYSNPLPTPPGLGANAPLPISDEIADTSANLAAAEPEQETEPNAEEAARLAAERLRRKAERRERRAAERLRRKAERRERRAADTTAIVTAWNAMAVTAKLARIAKLTDERRKKIGARLDEQTVEEIVEAINLIPQRSFCMGQNPRGWKADIDFLLRPNTVTKLLEGTAYTSGDETSWGGA
jgi:hypothetical protein